MTKKIAQNSYEQLNNFWSLIIRALKLVVALFILAPGLALAQTSPQNYTTAGSSTFVVPDGVKSITVQTWGGGGRGGGGSGTNLRMGGGGGGAYSTSVIAVTPGQSYTIVVGAGGSASEVNGGNTRFYLTSNPSVDLVRAAGGTGVGQATGGGAGGTVANSVGTTRYAGGTGANGDTGGGGGGSSAGTAATGVNGSGTTGGTAPTGGGNGGAGAASGTNPGSVGTAPGGGGGGARTQGNSTATGGNGGVGRAVLTFQKVDATETTVDISKTSVSADNIDQAILTIHAKDPSGANITNLVSGDFGFTGQSAATVANFTNTGGGIYTFTVKSTTVESINITATILNVNVGSTGSISFVTPPPSAANSTVGATPSSVLANGVSFSTLTVTVKNTLNNAMTGLTSGDFGFTGQGAASITDFTNTGSGVYTFRIRNTSAQTINVTVSVLSVSLGSTGNITYTTPTPNAGNSTIDASPTSVLANGFSASTITINVRDADNVPITGLNSGNFSFGNKGDANVAGFSNVGGGEYTFQAVNTTVETVNISVTVSSISLGNTGNISFISVLPNATNSTVDTDLTSAVANGQDVIELEIDLRDNSNNAITDALVSEFEFSGEGDATIGGFTNVGGGIYTFEITNTKAETINITVVVRTVNIGNTGNLTFTAQVPSAVNSILARNPTTVNADGIATSTLTITARDGGNLPIQDLVVGDFSFSGEGDANITGFSNTGSGIYTFQVTNSTEETVNIGVTVRSISLGNFGNITFQLTPPSAGNSSITADPLTVLANGSAQSVISLVIRDAGNVGITDLVSGDFIFSGEGNATIAGFSNNGSGNYSFTVTNTTVETINISLSVRSVSIGSTGNIVFVAVPNAGNSTVSADPLEVFADASEVSLLEIQVRDASNNVISNLSAGNFSFTGQGNASIGNFVNAGGGNYTFDVTNATIEAVNITVLARGISIGSTGNIDFIANPNASPAIFTTSGTFTVPNGVSQIRVQVWGAGGGGNVGDAGGGGGGGAYAEGILNVTPGQDYTIGVGTAGAVSTTGGSSSFSGNSFSFSAAGGVGNTGTGTVSGGAATSSFTGTYVSTATFAGGGGGSGHTGGPGGSRGGGGGGGSGTPSAAGSAGGNGSSGNNGLGGAGTGPGGNGAVGSGTAQAGNAPGGGGGGTGSGGTAGTGAPGRVTITFSQVNATNTIVNASPLSVTANGTSASVLTVTVRDQNDDPVTNLTSGNFSFTGEGDATIDNFTNTGSGIYTFDVKNNTVETINITVTVRGINVGSTGNIVFTSALPNAGNSSIDVDPVVVAANGTAVSELTITLKDGANNPVLGLLSGDFDFSGEGNATIANFQDLGSGVYSFDITNNTVENINISVTANTVSIGSTGTISFVLLPDAANSDVSANPVSLFANGIAVSVLTIEVRDDMDDPITGLTVSNFSISGEGNATVNGFTNVGGGIYTFDVKSSTPEVIDIGVVVNTVNLGSSGNITFLGFPSATNSSVSASPLVLAADGLDAATLTIEVLDASLNAITDLVSGDFGFSGQGSATINNFSNEGGGTYTFDVTNSTSQTIAIGVTIRTVVVGTSQSIEFFAVKTLYSYQSGNWHTANTWTEDPSGTTLVNPVVPGTEDNIVILNGRTVTLTENVTQENQSITINSGGVLDLANFRVQPLVSLSGSGTLRSRNIVSGSPDVAYFPTVTTNDFITASGGTVTYYQQGNVTLPTGIPSYRNLTIRNNSGSNYTFIQASNIQVFNNLLLDKVSSGTLTVQIGNSTTTRDIAIGGNVTVTSGATWTVGDFNASHTVEIGGDLVNNGQVLMQYNDVASYTNATPTMGRSAVTFTGSASNKIDAFGITRFYRLVIDKGIDQTHVLTVNSTNVANFKILGRNDQAIGTGDNPESDKALFIRNGTLRLKENILIESLTSGGTDFIVNKNASLWIDGAEVNTSTIVAGSTALTVIGKFRITDGELDAGDSAGVIIRNDAEIIVEGGVINASQMRPSTTVGLHTASLTVSGGTITLDGSGENNATFARLSMPYEDNSLTISGGTFIISTPIDKVGGGVEFGMDGSNINITGGTWTFIAPDGTGNFRISSTAPFRNVTMQKAGTGTGNVRLDTPLIVQNNLTVESGVFEATGNFNVTVGGNFTVSSGATYTPNDNTTIFNGTGAQSFIQNGTIGSSGMYNFTVNKSSGTLTLAGSATEFIVRNTFSLSSGTIDDNGKTIDTRGALTLSGAHIGTGKLMSNPSGNITISGNGNGQVSNFELRGTSANITYSLTSNLLINGSLVFVPDATNERILSIAGNNLQLGGSAGITGFNEYNFIRTNGFSSASGVSKVFDDEFSFTFPIGVTGKYTPAIIEFDVEPSVYGTITIRPVDIVHPAIDETDYALQYYWATTSTGFTLGSAKVTQVYKYVDTDLGIEVIDTDLVPGKFVGGLWVIGDNTGVNETTNEITFGGATFETSIDGDYTTADNVNGAPFGELTVYYSRNGGGDWFDNTTWSTTGHDGSAAASFPGLGTVAVVGDGHTVTVNSNSARSAFIEILTGSTLDIGSTNDHNFGTLQGASYGTLRIGSSYFPGGDFTAFFNNGTVVYYRIGSDYTIPTSSVTKPTLDLYYNLHVEVESGAGTPFIALPNLDLDILNNFRAIGTSTDHQIRLSDGASAALTVNGGLFVDSGSLRYRFAGSNNRTVTVTGDVTIASGASFTYYDNSDVVHSLTISGNLVNNGTIDFNTSAARTANIIFTGTNSRNYSGSGANTFARIEVNKGSSQTPVLTLSNSGSLTFPSGGIVLTNGTLNITRDGTLVFSNTGSGYSIPATSALVINNADLTVRIGYTNDNAADLSLSGRLEITAGTVEVGNSANDNNNDIVYASAGNPEIKLTGGVLDVNGQIRRLTSSVNGALTYRQSGSSIVRIRGRSLNNTRGVIEVVNTGSIFEMSGTSQLHIYRGGSVTYQDVYLLPASSSVTGGTILFRPDGAGSQTYTLNSTTPLYDITVENDGANTATVTQLVNSITINNNLSLSATSTYNASALNMTIGGTFVKNATATFTPGNNTVTFNGNTSVLDGDFSSNNFFNLTVAASQNLTLEEGTELRINNTLTINSGATLNEDALGNEIDMRGNVVNNGTHTSPVLSSTLGLLMNHTSSQSLSGSGVYGNVINNNNAGLSITSDVEIAGRLTLNNSSLTISDNRLTLGVNAEVTNYNSTRYISSNGVVSDGGVRKRYPSGADSFEFPIGVFSKYTPATIDITANGATGTVTVKPVNVKHPSTRLVADQQLNYYWAVSSTGFSGLEVTHTYNYLQGDVTGTESNYRTGRFTGTNWTPVGGIAGTVNTTSNQMVLEDVNYISGDYTAGSEGEFGGVDIFYSRNSVCDQPTGCIWNDVNSWSADGHTGVAAISFPNGEPVIISNGHRVRTNGNNRLSESLILNGNAILDVEDNTGHSLGAVSGTGTIRVKATGANQFVFPGGNFTDFAAENTGNVEFYGTTSGILPTQTAYNNVFMLENSARNYPDVNWTVNGNFTLDDGTIDNTTFNRNITLHKNWINNSSATAFVPGTGKVILAGANQQYITGDFGTTFGTLELTGGGAKNIEQPVRIQSGINFSSGNIFLNEHDMTWNNGVTIGGTPSVTSMVVINDEGKLRREINAAGTITFPVGNDIGSLKYSPATLTFTSGSFSSAFVEMGVSNNADVECGGGNYLNRFWSVELSGITSFAGSGIFTYLSGDVVGTESSIFTLSRNFADTNCTFGSAANTVNKTLSLDLTSTGFIITGGDAGDLLPPNVQPSDIQFINVTANSMTIEWTNGDGTGRIVLARSESAVDSGPVDDVIYTADDDFSGAPDEIGTDNFVVYTGSGNSFNLTGLDQNTRYYFTIYEYNSIGPKISYLSTTPPSANQITKAIFEITFTGDKGWRMIALPLEDTTYEDVFDGPGLITQGFTGSTASSDAPNLLWYIESQTGTDNQRWAQPSNITNTVVPGRGYMYYVFGDIDGDARYNDEFPIDVSVVAFETELSTSEFDFNVTYTVAADSGWNLLGNPFVGDLDWDNDDEWTKTNVMNAIYVWDPSANSGAGDYLTWSFPTGDVALGGLIAKGQSFWVKANADDPELAVTRNAVTTGATSFMKEMANENLVMEEDYPGIQLTLRKGLFEKNAYITFNENSSRSLDKHDAYFLQPLSDTYLAFYTQSVDNQNLTINSLPRRFNTPIEVPVFIGGFENGTSLSGNYEVALGELTNIPVSWEIELIDKNSNKKVIWKAAGETTFRNEIGMGPASIKSKQNPSNSEATDHDYRTDDRFSEHYYGFEFNYEKVLQIEAPQPGDPIIMKSLPGTTQSRFVLRISPNGEFDDIPEDFTLYQNYPNPFNPTTTIRFGLPIEENIRLDVFDVLGRQITTLAQGVYGAGTHTVQFDGRSLASGVYLVRMQTGRRVQTMKMLLIK